MMLVTLGAICLAGASLATGSPLEPRQLGLTSMLSSASFLLPRQNGKITATKPRLRTDAKRSIIRYGPYKLRAYKVSPRILPDNDSIQIYEISYELNFYRTMLLLRRMVGMPMVAQVAAAWAA
jgi:hypothetical protein